MCQQTFHQKREMSLTNNLGIDPQYGLVGYTYASFWVMVERSEGIMDETF